MHQWLAAHKMGGPAGPGAGLGGKDTPAGPLLVYLCKTIFLFSSPSSWHKQGLETLSRIQLS